MQKQSIARTLALAGRLLGVGGVLVASAFAQKSSATNDSLDNWNRTIPVCSSHMLKGHYATLIQGAYGQGTIPGTQTYGPATPFQGIQMLNFDGKGNISGSEQLVAGGFVVTQDENSAPIFVPVTGTYKLNSDCTGTAYISSSHNGVTENFVYVGLVLADGGKTFYMLVVSPFDGAATDNGPGTVRTITSIGTRVEPTVPAN